MLIPGFGPGRKRQHHACDLHSTAWTQCRGVISAQPSRPGRESVCMHAAVHEPCACPDCQLQKMLNLWHAFQETELHCFNESYQKFATHSYKRCYNSLRNEQCDSPLCSPLLTFAGGVLVSSLETGLLCPATAAGTTNGKIKNRGEFKLQKEQTELI